MTIERNELSPNASIFLTSKIHIVTYSRRVRVNFWFDLRYRGTYDTKGSRKEPLLASAVQSTLCTRRDNNLLTRTCRLRKEGPAGRRGRRTGLSYECEFLSRAAWLRGWKEKKRSESWGITSTELFVVTRIHQACFEWDLRPFRGAIEIKKGLIIAK